MVNESHDLSNGITVTSFCATFIHSDVRLKAVSDSPWSSWGFRAIILKSTLGLEPAAFRTQALRSRPPPPRNMKNFSIWTQIRDSQSWRSKVEVLPCYLLSSAAPHPTWSYRSVFRERAKNVSLHLFSLSQNLMSLWCFEPVYKLNTERDSDGHS